MTSTNRLKRNGIALAVFAATVIAAGSVARAQVTPAEGSTPPDDTPSVKVGGVIFSDYTYIKEPETTDLDGRKIKTKGFDVRRAYLNITGNITHAIQFRITPDVTRETIKLEGGEEGEKVTLSTDGSLVYRLKYAYGQFNLDDWMTKGSYVKFGMQQTPYIDFMEPIYKYRFQGTNFTEREGLLSSSDFALGFRYAFPHNFGDVVLGYYNGDAYTKAESNDQQALMIRASIRPAPKAGALSGLRLTAFYDDDRYARSDPKQRFLVTVSFEHKYVNAAFEYAKAKDQKTAASTEVDSSGYSVWVIPKTTFGLEGLLRMDKFEPDNDKNGDKTRTIVGIAYWFKVQKGVAACVMLDYDGLTYGGDITTADDKRYALHTLFQF